MANPETLITLDGGALTDGGGVLMRDCAFPITTLMKRCPPDGVVMNMPVSIGTWAPGTIAPYQLDWEITVDTTDADSCNGATVFGNVVTCEAIAPSQAKLRYQTTSLDWEELSAQFCRMRNIHDPFVLDNIFDANGNIITGQPYAIDFVRFALGILLQTLQTRIATEAIIGDSANPGEFDGLHTQILGGWEESLTHACPDYLNQALTIDWAVLTDEVSPTFDSVTARDGEIENNLLITIWGEVCEVPAGLNFAQFLEDFWFPKLREFTDAAGGVTEYEMHVAANKQYCLPRSAACVQPCDFNGEFDQTLRDRYAEASNTSIVTLYPSGRSFPVFATNHMADDEILIGPRTIGGLPTYGLFFRNIDNVLGSLGPLGDTYGQYVGGTGGVAQDPLMPMKADWVSQDVEAQTIYWDVEKVSAFCVRAAMMAVVGVLATSRHLWLHVENVNCASACADCDDGIVVDPVVEGGG